MNCDKCGITNSGAPWFLLSYNDDRHAFCSRRCLIEFIAPELNKAVVVTQWVPTEEDIRRMSEEST